MSGAGAEEKFEVEGDMRARERKRSRNCLTERGVKYDGATLYISGCGEIFAFRLPAFTIMSNRGGGGGGGGGGAAI